MWAIKLTSIKRSINYNILKKLCSKSAIGFENKNISNYFDHDRDESSLTNLPVKILKYNTSNIKLLVISYYLYIMSYEPIVCVIESLY